MAKTSKSRVKKGKGVSSLKRVRTKGQSRRKKKPPETPVVWTPEELIRGLRAGTRKQKIERLKRIGVLTPTGRLARKYQNWGKKITRTPEAPEP